MEIPIIKNMPGFEHGYERAISVIFGGVILWTFLNAISSNLSDPSFLLYLKLFNMFGTISLILAMPYWGTMYLFGWLFGLMILANSGLVGILDFVIYFGIPLMILIIRISKSA